jgi:hypothetical protein
MSINRRKFLSLLAGGALAVPAVAAMVSRPTCLFKGEIGTVQDWRYVQKDSEISFSRLMAAKATFEKRRVRPTKIDGVNYYQLVVPADNARFYLDLKREWPI